MARGSSYGDNSGNKMVKSICFMEIEAFQFFLEVLNVTVRRNYALWRVLTPRRSYPLVFWGVIGQFV